MDWLPAVLIGIAEALAPTPAHQVGGEHEVKMDVQQTEDAVTITVTIPRVRVGVGQPYVYQSCLFERPGHQTIVVARPPRLSMEYGSYVTSCDPDTLRCCDEGDL